VDHRDGVVAEPPMQVRNPSIVELDGDDSRS
jgi:hypothetical protein